MRNSINRHRSQMVAAMAYVFNGKTTETKFYGSSYRIPNVALSNERKAAPQQLRKVTAVGHNRFAVTGGSSEGGGLRASAIENIRRAATKIWNDAVNLQRRTRKTPNSCQHNYGEPRNTESSIRTIDDVEKRAQQRTN
jgi:hypothetical protein